MTLDRDARPSGASARTWSSRPRNALRVAEPAHPAQHRRRWRAGRTGRSTARRRASSAIASTSAGPRLGGLEVGHPHPLDAVDRGQLGQQRLEQPQVAEVLAVRRGVLADQEQLAHALLGQPAASASDLVGRPARRTSRGRTGSRRTSSAGRSRRPASAAPSGRRRAGGAAARGPVAGAWPGQRDVGRGAAAGARRPGEIGSSSAPVLRACAGAAPRRPGSTQPRARCRGSRRSRAPRRPRAATRRAPRRSARPGSRRRRRPGRPVLEVGGRQQGVDRVLLGRLDEAAGVDHDRRRRRSGRRPADSRRPRAGRRAPRSRPRCGRSRGSPARPSAARAAGARSRAAA